MGYYTDYKLSVENGDPFDEVKEKVASVSGYAGWVLWELHDVKWYDHEKHILEVSLLYPDKLIKLEGVGEEKGDMWCTYFLGGKLQNCKAEITFPDFDSNKLK